MFVAALLSCLFGRAPTSEARAEVPVVKAAVVVSLTACPECKVILNE